MSLNSGNTDSVLSYLIGGPAQAYLDDSPAPPAMLQPAHVEGVAGTLGSEILHAAGQAIQAGAPSSTASRMLLCTQTAAWQGASPLQCGSGLMSANAPRAADLRPQASPLQERESAAAADAGSWPAQSNCATALGLAAEPMDAPVSCAPYSSAEDQDARFRTGLSEAGRAGTTRAAGGTSTAATGPVPQLLAPQIAPAASPQQAAATSGAHSDGVDPVMRALALPMACSASSLLQHAVAHPDSAASGAASGTEPHSGASLQMGACARDGVTALEVLQRAAAMQQQHAPDVPTAAPATNAPVRGDAWTALHVLETLEKRYAHGAVALCDTAAAATGPSLPGGATHHAESEPLAPAPPVAGTAQEGGQPSDACGAVLGALQAATEALEYAEMHIAAVQLPHGQQQCADTIIRMQALASGLLVRLGGEHAHAPSRSEAAVALPELTVPPAATPSLLNGSAQPHDRDVAQVDDTGEDPGIATAYAAPVQDASDVASPAAVLPQASPAAVPPGASPAAVQPQASPAAVPAGRAAPRAQRASARSVECDSDDEADLASDLQPPSTKAGPTAGVGAAQAAAAARAATLVSSPRDRDDAARVAGDVAGNAAVPCAIRSGSADAAQAVRRSSRSAGAGAGAAQRDSTRAGAHHQPVAPRRANRAQPGAPNSDQVGAQSTPAPSAGQTQAIEPVLACTASAPADGQANPSRNQSASRPDGKQRRHNCGRSPEPCAASKNARVAQLVAGFEQASKRAKTSSQSAAPAPSQAVDLPTMAMPAAEALPEPADGGAQSNAAASDAGGISRAAAADQSILANAELSASHAEVYDTAGDSAACVPTVAPAPSPRTSEHAIQPYACDGVIGSGGSASEIAAPACADTAQAAPGSASASQYSDHAASPALGEPEDVSAPDLEPAAVSSARAGRKRARDSAAKSSPYPSGQLVREGSVRTAALRTLEVAGAARVLGAPINAGHRRRPCSKAANTAHQRASSAPSGAHHSGSVGDEHDAAVDVVVEPVPSSNAQARAGPRSRMQDATVEVSGGRAASASVRTPDGARARAATVGSGEAVEGGTPKLSSDADGLGALRKLGLGGCEEMPAADSPCMRTSNGAHMLTRRRARPEGRAPSCASAAGVVASPVPLGAVGPRPVKRQRVASHPEHGDRCVPAARRAL